MASLAQWLSQQLTSQPLTDNRTLRRHLADQLGYSNRNKALRRIDALLQQGKADSELRTRLSQLLQMPTSVLDQHILAAREQQWHQQREALFASTGAILIAIVPKPRQITFAGLLHDHKRCVKLPADLPQCSEEHQRTVLRQTIDAFISREGTSIPLFGPVSGFAYVNSPHTHWLLDTQGQVIEQSDKPFANRFFAARLAQVLRDFSSMPAV